MSSKSPRWLTALVATATLVGATAMADEPRPHITGIDYMDALTSVDDVGIPIQEAARSGAHGAGQCPFSRTSSVEHRLGSWRP